VQEGGLCHPNGNLTFKKGVCTGKKTRKGGEVRGGGFLNKGKYLRGGFELPVSGLGLRRFGPCRGGRMVEIGSGKGDDHNVSRIGVRVVSNLPLEEGNRGRENDGGAH